MKLRFGSIVFLVGAIQATAQDSAKSASTPGSYQLKNRSAFSVPANTRAPFIPIGWAKKDGPIVVVQRANFDEAAFRVTSILLGNPSLAVINGKSYGEGEFLRMPRGGPQLRIRVHFIGDGKVLLEYEGKLFAAPLKRPELGDRKAEEPLLNEERDAVPMPAPPTSAPVGSSATATPPPVKLR